MVAEAGIVCQQTIQVMDVQYHHRYVTTNLQKIEEIVDVSTTKTTTTTKVLGSSSSILDQVCASEDSVSLVVSRPEAFLPSIRSGSFTDIGRRKSMEDEHIRIDDLSSHLGSLFSCPVPTAFYGVFDGHGGPEAAAYVKENAMRFFFEDVKFPQTTEADNFFVEEVENSVRKSFLRADLALADDCLATSSGTTALTALVLGRILLVANAGDCRAVLSRKGQAIEMSQDHKPIYPSERKRVEDLGGYVDYGYLNGVLSVTRALGDWDMKLPRGSPSPLIADPEFRQMVLTEEDEFLIIGCDGIWDVMSSQQAVSLVRRGLRRHANPDRSARELVTEALRLDSDDNLTVVIVCFSTLEPLPPLPSRQRRLRCCSLSAEAICSLKSLLNGNENN